MKRQFLSLAVWLLALSPVLAQSNTIPRPNENLNAYEARMTAYFAPQMPGRGVEALVKDESSEYNRYLRFLRLWKPRVSDHRSTATSGPTSNWRTISTPPV